MSIKALRENLKNPKPNGLGAEEEYWTVKKFEGLIRMFIVSVCIFLDVENPIINNKWGKLQAELPIHQVEAATKLCHSVGEIEECLYNLRCAMQEKVAEHGATLDMRSTPWHDFPIDVFPKKRYIKIKAHLGIKLQPAWITGLHIHHGIASIDDGIKISNVMRDLLALFVAISQCSPAKFGLDRGFGSERLLTYLGMSDNPVPPMIDNEDHFDKIARDEGFYGNLADCWWWGRLNTVGSFELRICDMQPEVAHVGQIMALFRVCIAMIREGHLIPSGRSKADILREVTAAAMSPQAHRDYLSFIQSCSDWAARKSMTEEVFRIMTLIMRLKNKGE